MNDIFTKILTLQTDPNALDDNDYTPLMEIFRNKIINDVPESLLRTMVNEARILPNTQGKNGETALHIVARRYSGSDGSRVLGILLGVSRFDVNLCNTNRKTAYDVFKAQNRRNSNSMENRFTGAGAKAPVEGEAGTTRDALTVHYKHFGKEFLLIDTAGVRKRAKMKGQVEFFSTLRALSALQACDVCLFLIDAQLGLEAQDLHLLDLAHRYHKGIFVVCK